MKKVSQEAIVIVISFLLVFLSLLPFLYQLIDTPKNHVFLGVYNNVLDYYHFLSEIALGQRGHFLVIDKMTPEPQAPTMFHELNLVFGLLASPFTLSPVLIYHLARIAIGLSYLIATFYFVKEFFKDKTQRIVAFILAATQAGFLKITNTPSGLKFDEFLSFWSGGNPLRRILFLPNSMLRDLFFLIAAVLMFRAFEKKSVRLAVFGGFLSALIAIQSPIHSIMLVAIFTLYVIYKVATLPSTTHNDKIKDFFALIAFALISLPALLYINSVTNNPPYLTAKLWEQSQTYNIPVIDFILLQGPLFFLAVPGLATVILNLVWDLKTKRTSKITTTQNTGDANAQYFFLAILALLTIIPLILPITKPLGLTNFRFFGFPLNIILAVFAVKTLILLRNKLRLPESLNTKYHILVAVLLLLLSLPTYVYSLATQPKEFAYYSNVYPTKTWMNGLNYLKINTKEEDIVLADLYSGNIIPAFTKASVYLGHPVLTVDADNKAKTVTRFFQGKMTADEAESLLSNSKITYVFFDTNAGKGKTEAPPYRNLIKVFENEEVEIYKTK